MAKETGDSQFDVRDIFALALRRKWLIIIPLILVTAAALAGTYLLTPEYESSIIVQVDTPVHLIGEIQRLIGEQQGYNNQSARARQDQLRSYANELTSLNFVSQLNEVLKLEANPEVEKQAQAYVGQQPNLSIERARLNVIQDRLKKNLMVSWAAGDQIMITATATDAIRARDIANALSDIFIREKTRQRLDMIRTSQDFSDIQLEKYENLLASKVAERTALERELLSLRAQEADPGSTNRQNTLDEINQLTTQIEILSDDEETMRRNLRTTAGISGNRLTLEGSEAKDEKVNELWSRLPLVTDLVSRFTWSDPQILNFNVREGNLLLAVEKENGKLVAAQFAEEDPMTRKSLTDFFNLQTNLEYLKRKKPYLQQALDNIAPSLSKLPEYEARLAQLDREIVETTDIRDRFKRQQESSSISQALAQDGAVARYRVLEPAKLAVAPVFPNRKKILGLGIVLGLFIGCGIALMVELMDSSFKRVEDVEEMLTLQVIGISPRVEFMDKVQR